MKLRIDLQKRTQELHDQLNAHNHQYYALDNPTITDAEYDQLFHELRQRGLSR